MKIEFNKTYPIFVQGFGPLNFRAIKEGTFPFGRTHFGIVQVPNSSKIYGATLNVEGLKDSMLLLQLYNSPLTQALSELDIPMSNERLKEEVAETDE